MSKSKEDLSAFVTDFERKKTAVVVEEPETVQEKGMFGTKEYTTFLIMTKKLGKDPVGVRHRYSEFETFRTACRARYGPMGILVPALPAKRVLGKGEWNFVIERMYGLTLFCQAFVENPFLASDQSWAQFTYPSDYAPGIENPAECWLQGSLGHVAVPDNARERLTSIEEETTVVEYYTKACFEKFKACQSTLKNHQIAQDALTTDVTKWATEEDYLIAFGGRGIDTLGVRLPENEKPIKSVVGLKDFYTRSTNIGSRNQQYIGLFECAIMEHVIGLIEGMKELFKSHTALVAEIDGLKNKIYKLNLTKTPTPKTDAAIMEAKSSLAGKEAMLSSWYKAFFHYSLPLFARRRAACLKQMALSVASYSLSQAVASEKASRRLFEDMTYSSATASVAVTAQLVKLSTEEMTCLPDDYKHVEGDKSVPLPAFSGLMERAMDPSTATTLDDAAEQGSKHMPRGDVFSWKHNPVNQIETGPSPDADLLPVASDDGAASPVPPAAADGDTEKFV